MNNSGKQKSKAQSLYVTLLVLLMTVAVVVAIAGAVAKNVSRNNRGEVEETTEESGANAFADEGGEKADNNKNKESEKTRDEESAAVLPEDTDKSEKEQNKAEDTTDSAADRAEVLPTFSAPTDGAVINKYSGTVPVFSLTMEDWRTHGGVDLAAEPGSDVKAAADGVIKEVWDDPMMGKCVSVEHSGGAVTIYKNLADELPGGTEAGVSVKAGDVIACAGESALEEIAEEGHIHFEMTVNGSPVDPCDYITFSQAESYEG